MTTRSGNAYHGAGQSNVGHAAFYEAGDQRNEPRSVQNERDRYKEGQHGSHQNLDTSMSFIVVSPNECKRLTNGLQRTNAPSLINSPLKKLVDSITITIPNIITLRRVS